MSFLQARVNEAHKILVYRVGLCHFKIHPFKTDSLLILHSVTIIQTVSRIVRFNLLAFIKKYLSNELMNAVQKGF